MHRLNETMLEFDLAMIIIACSGWQPWHFTSPEKIFEFKTKVNQNLFIKVIQQYKQNNKTVSLKIYFSNIHRQSWLTLV